MPRLDSGLDPSLSSRLTELRRTLESREDAEAGFIAPPSSHESFPEEIPPPYQAFLRHADGLALGAVLLFESDAILRMQLPAKALPGGRARWFCIGSMNEESLVIDKKLNTIYVVDPEGGLDPDGALGELNYFLEEYVLNQPVL